MRTVLAEVLCAEVEKPKLMTVFASTAIACVITLKMYEGKTLPIIL